MRFHIVGVRRDGYAYVCSVTAPSLQEAAAMHVAIYRKRKTSTAYVMRGPDGRRYSVAESEALAGR